MARGKGAAIFFGAALLLAAGWAGRLLLADRPTDSPESEGRGVVRRVDRDLGAPSADAATRATAAPVGRAAFEDVSLARVGPVRFVARLRLDGAPLVGTDVIVRCSRRTAADPARTEVVDLVETTASDGAVACDWPLPTEDAEAPTLTFIAIDETGEPGARRVIELEAPMIGGVSDFGVVELVRFPVLASGRVLDDRGVPIPGAAVELGERLEGDDARERKSYDAPLVGLTDREGRFELRGRDAIPSTYAFRASAALHAPSSETPPKFVPGDATPIELRLIRCGSLSVALRYGGSPPQTGAYHFTLTGPRSLRRTSKSEAQGGDSTFLELPPGSYALEVRAFSRLPGFRRLYDLEPFVVVRDLVVEAGETLRDPRILPLELLTALMPIRVRVAGVPGEGTAPFAASVKAFSLDAPIPIVAFGEPVPLMRGSVADGGTDVGGEALLLVPRRGVDLLVIADGRTPRLYRHVVGDLDVALEKLTPIEVLLEGNAEPTDDLEAEPRRAALVRFDGTLPDGLQWRSERMLMPTAWVRLPRSGSARLALVGYRPEPPPESEEHVPQGTAANEVVLRTVPLSESARAPNATGEPIVIRLPALTRDELRPLYDG